MPKNKQPQAATKSDAQESPYYQDAVKNTESKVNAQSDTLVTKVDASQLVTPNYIVNGIPDTMPNYTDSGNQSDSPAKAEKAAGFGESYKSFTEAGDQISKIMDAIESSSSAAAKSLQDYHDGVATVDEAVVSFVSELPIIGNAFKAGNSIARLAGFETADSITESTKKSDEETNANLTYHSRIQDTTDKGQKIVDEQHHKAARMHMTPTERAVDDINIDYDKVEAKVNHDYENTKTESIAYKQNNRKTIDLKNQLRVAEDEVKERDEWMQITKEIDPNNADQINKVEKEYVASVKSRDSIKKQMIDHNKPFDEDLDKLEKQRSNQIKKLETDRIKTIDDAQNRTTTSSPLTHGSITKGTQPSLIIGISPGSSASTQPSNLSNTTTSVPNPQLDLIARLLSQVVAKLGVQ